MSIRQKSSGTNISSLDNVVKSSSVVVVAVKASKEISRNALTWALTNVVRPGIALGCLCSFRLIIAQSKNGVVASEAKRAQTQWVILDKRMKKEANFCMEQLDCNVIVVKNSEPKVLRLNLIEPKTIESEVLPFSKSSTKRLNDDFDLLNTIKVPNVTPTSSPDRISSMSSLDNLFTSPIFMSEINWDPKVKHISPLSFGDDDFDESDTDSGSGNLSSRSTSMCSQLWMEDNLSSADEGSKRSKEGLQRSWSKAPNLMSEICKALGKGPIDNRSPEFCKNVRDMISLNKKATSDSPPLCSVCQHKSPFFGQPPRMFSYSELEQATSGFSEANFLAEGGYGCVHRGVLPDGQVIAVKQHKLASTQGDREFCSEVQVLSCAQHRNVVMLIGYCVEDRRRLLVYEYICNGSLDSHLYGRNQSPLDWAARQKIAVGAARGLRYLHEECRVGCIVHRDMRPNNILLTHDFEPLVGDFGLARLEGDGDSSVETRIIGTFGYIAPEYAQTGQVSEKADVYSFGVILVELVTGRKAVDINRPKGEQCLTEWVNTRIENPFICYTTLILISHLFRASWEKRGGKGIKITHLFFLMNDSYYILVELNISAKSRLIRL
ncbi:hypothetical protein DH2020_014568 [Rehmannia glutinosa]|uniref:Protein kinase domain-containing protein n=1 Tax=Rehmannia glutinosa TaxID=99300 RepID=A0ABR0WWS6_REHGL